MMLLFQNFSENSTLRLWLFIHRFCYLNVVLTAGKLSLNVDYRIGKVRVESINLCKSDYLKMCVFFLNEKYQNKHLPPELASTYVFLVPMNDMNHLQRRVRRALTPDQRSHNLLSPVTGWSSDSPVISP